MPTKVLQKRAMVSVVQTHIELNHNLDSRLVGYCGKFGFSKRRIIEDALFIWLNQRDMEAKERASK